MTSPSIVSRFAFLSQLPNWLHPGRNGHGRQPDMHALTTQPDLLPKVIANSPTAMRYLKLLGPLAWNQFPERNLDWPTPTVVVPYAAFAAACLVKLDQGLPSTRRSVIFSDKNEIGTTCLNS